jgi:hypothetical protein
VPVRSSTFPVAICPASILSFFFHQTSTVQQPPASPVAHFAASGSYVASVTRPLTG